jgi:TolC family type I secretion outer membrane protein
MKIGMIWLVIFLIIPTMVFSQEKKPLSLNECISIALDNNSQLKIAERQLEIANKNYKGSYSNILPSIDLSSSMSKYEQGPSSYAGGSFVGSGAIPSFSGENYNFQATVSQNIFDGGYWWNNIRKTKSDKKAQEFYQLSEKQRTIVMVQESYFNLLKAIKLLEVDDQAVKRSQEQLDRTEAQFELGAVAKVDVFQTRTNLGNDRIEYLTQKNIVEKAKQDLNLAMGRDPQESLEIETDTNISQELGKLDEMIDQAVANNPSLKQLEQDLRSAQLQTKLAFSSFIPSVGAYYSYSRRVPELNALYKDFFDQEYYWSLGLQLRWNVFNGFSDLLNVQKSKINEKITREQIDDARRNIVSSVKSLVDNLKSYKEIIDINRENLESAREQYRLAQERYRVGSGTALEVREAQVGLTRAEQILVSAENNSIITYAQLQEALGELATAY